MSLIGKAREGLCLWALWASFPRVRDALGRMEGRLDEQLVPSFKSSLAAIFEQLSTNTPHASCCLAITVSEA